MFRLHLVKYETKFDFIGKSKFILPMAILLLITSSLFIFFKGVNYGIDFRGGYVLEVKMPETPDIPSLRTKLSSLSLGDVAIQQFGNDDELLIKLERGDENLDQEEAIGKIKKSLGNGVTYKKIETVGPKVGSELVSNAIKAVIFALIAMLIYIMIRFEWQFGICALVALIHDCAFIFGMFSVFPIEFNEMSITAILLTASYSINDTVVIFDRIRENLKRYRDFTLSNTINKSLNETLSRTTLTATTTILAVLSMYLFGGKVISAFSFPILIGIAIGTLSSIFIASPLLVFMNITHKESSKSSPANLD